MKEEKIWLMMEQWVELAWNSLKYQSLNSRLIYFPIIYYWKVITVGCKDTSEGRAVGMRGRGKGEHDNSTLDLWNP